MITTQTAVIKSTSGAWLNIIPVIGPRTLRLLFKQGTKPYIGSRDIEQYPINVGRTVDVGKKGTFKRISRNPNIWDWTYNNNDWTCGLWYQYDLLKVLGADSTNVTNMSKLFLGCSSLQEVCLFDTSLVTDTSYMFGLCESLRSIATYNTANVTNMSYMFCSAGHPSTSQGLMVIPELNTTKVTDMSYMFSGTRASVYPDMYTPALTNPRFMFYSNFTVINAPALNMSNVTNATCMFDEAQKLKTVPLYDLSNLTNMYRMFANCMALESIPSFNITKVTNMFQTFGSCYNCSSGQYDIYHTAATKAIAVTNHYRTFYDCGTNTQTGTAELARIASDWK